MNIANLKISMRLSIGFGLVLMLLAGVATLGISGMSGTNDALHRIVGTNVPKMKLLEDMSNSVHIVARVMRTIALINSEAESSNQKKKIGEAREIYDAAFAALRKTPLDAHR
jgi:methyl-accepting chemotaxis protein